MIRILSLTVILVAACGGDDDKKKESAVPSAPAPTTPTPATPGEPGLPPGMPSMPPGGMPAGMPDLSKLGGQLDLNADTGIAECNELFTYVRDTYLKCETIPQQYRDMQRLNLAGVNQTIRMALNLKPELKAKVNASCIKGLEEARKDYAEHCK